MKLDWKFFNHLLSQPMAPYREHLVRQTLVEYLQSHGVAHCLDPIGNIVVGVDSQQAYEARIRTPDAGAILFFVAHMDHPGFHGLKWKRPNLLSAKWFGGGPTQKLVGATVWVSDDHGCVSGGKIQSAKLSKTKTRIESLEIQLKGLESDRPETLFGGLGFKKPIWKVGKKFFTKAADDLVGAFMITQLARKYQGSPRFLGLLTRAEEVGFVGAIGHMELNWWTKAARPWLGVSLETSRTLPGALIGAGPVVRQGDRTSLFDPAAVQWLWELANQTLKLKQKRVMDGGSCEATVMTAWGWRALGLSLIHI